MRASTPPNRVDLKRRKRALVRPFERSTDAPADDLRHPRRLAPRDRRNLIVLATYQILLRLAWVFKTESVIVPAFLDMIAGPGWVRGCLPILNRFGQSVPPVLFARRLAAMRRKKMALALFTVLQGVPFLTLAAVWALVGQRRPMWLPPLFLLLYAIFFACTGISQLSLNTVYGKLVDPRRRGRLLSVSFFSGALIATSTAWWLLGKWLAIGPHGFTFIFLFTGCVFAVTGCWALLLAEPADTAAPTNGSMRHYVLDLYQTVRRDRQFRRLVPVALLFATVLILFPHYQALGRQRLGLSGVNLMVFVVVQNLSLGLFSLVAGPLGDRRGNRLALRWLLLGCATTPLWAVVLAWRGPQGGATWFWTIYIPLGLTPVTMRTLIHYTLELSPPNDHPRYVSALSVCLAVPFVSSPLVGWLIDHTSFEAVLLCGAAAIFLSSLLTLRLAEPRQQTRRA